MIINAQNKAFIITQNSPGVITNSTFEESINAGDTIFVDAKRTKALFFENLEGQENLPIIVMNKNEVVEINDSTAWAALQFKNCKHFKVSGTGNKNEKYGFRLLNGTAGIGVTELSSHFLIENIEIDHNGFFGIQVKKDYHGNPPFPYPVFNKLVIRNCFIKNVAVGLYIGETQTPGMLFKHVKLFNNIVYHTQREAIQLSNSTEDVEVHHNLVYITGRAHENQQGNGIQIGDNTIGDYYRNIILNSTEYGFIVFGAGDINISDNYIAENKGIFADNRKVSYTYSDIEINNNFFREIANENILSLFNSKNNFLITNNHWYAADNFLRQNISNNVTIVEENNQYHYFEPLDIANFTVSANNPNEYFNFGPQENNNFEFNYVPKIEVEDFYCIDWETRDTIKILAKTEDNDVVSFSLKDTLNFTFLKDNGNGTAEIILSPKIENKGIYTATIIAWDHSHHQKSRKQIQISVKNPANQAPTIAVPKNLEFVNLQKSNLLIEMNDPENDQVYIETKNFPSFLKLIENNAELEPGKWFSANTSVYLLANPRYIDTGLHPQIALFICDGFGGSDSVYFSIEVTQNPLHGQTIIYRINCGGPEVADSPINWEPTRTTFVPYQISNMHNTGSYTWSGENTSLAPDSIFGPFSYSAPFDNDMHWQFNCRNGDYTVNLFFSERQQDLDENKLSVFNVKINGSNVLNQFSIYNESGLAALKKSFNIAVSKQKIDINFERIENNPKINGIEIILNKLEYPVKLAELKKENTLFVYPNPAQNEITLQNGNKQIQNIYLFNSQGIKIPINYSQNNFNTKINVHHFPKGIYMIKVKYTDNSTQTSKIMLN